MIACIVCFELAVLKILVMKDSKPFFILTVYNIQPFITRDFELWFLHFK